MTTGGKGARTPVIFFGCRQTLPFYKMTVGGFWAIRWRIIIVLKVGGTSFNIITNSGKAMGKYLSPPNLKSQFTTSSFLFHDGK